MRLMISFRYYLFSVVLVSYASIALCDGFPPALRGPVAVLLRPETGPLTITLSKRDLNLYQGADELTAVLTDPQRRVLATITLPDDGQAEKGRRAEQLQTATIRVTCDQSGIYRLLVRCSGDLVYGFETNCKRFVIEGWPLFNDPAFGGKIYFRPPKRVFHVAAAALHEQGRQKVTLLDSAGAAVHIFDLTQTVERPENLFGPKSGGYVAGVKAEIPADIGDRSRLWAFDVAKWDVRFEVQGMSTWSTSPEAWFDAEKSRWMLLPYRVTRYLQPGDTAQVTFQLRNNTGSKGIFRLTVSTPEDLSLRVLQPYLALEPNTTQDIQVEVTLPASAPTDRTLCATLTARHETEPDAVASAGLVVHRGEPPARRPLRMPILLKPYQHENMLFGYAPDYVCNEVYFDRQNRPWIRHRTSSAYICNGLTVLTEQGWVERPFPDDLRNVTKIFGGGFLGAKIAFDVQGGAYTLLKIRRKDKQPALLVFTPDEGRTYSTCEFEANAFDIEQFTGHNTLDIPPPILGYRHTRPHHAPFCGYHDLELYLPRREGEKIRLEKVALVSDNCVGSCQHSGGPASLVTREGKTHIVWGEVAPDDAPGVPTYIATYDQTTRCIGKKVFLAYAPPVNDVHNVPAITMDSQGFIHVLTGAHGEPFKYLRSLKPNDAYSGFTPPVEVLSAGCVEDGGPPEGKGRQTYISLVCGPDDTLHIAYRQWRRKVDEYHSGQQYAALSYQRKPKDGPWSAARPLVIPPVPGYSIYYHKLTIDRAGRLYLSYSYWTNDKSYQDDFPERYHHRAVLTSVDGGITWKLAETEDFRKGIFKNH